VDRARARGRAARRRADGAAAEAERLARRRGRDRDEREGRDRDARYDAEADEERRRDAWLDRPGWLKYWDDEARDFAVPEGWPPGSDGAPEEPEARATEPEAAPDTFMHRMLRGERP
jgi:hypothetical protein